MCVLIAKKMVYCQAFGCKNASGKGLKKSFHSIPNKEKQPELFRQWAAAIKVDKFFNNSYKHSRHDVICSDHFVEEDWEEDIRARLTGAKPRKMLKTCVVPSIFPHRRAVSPREATASTSRISNLESRRLQELDLLPSFTMEGQVISTMREMKEEVLDEEPQTSEREGYRIIYIKQEIADENTWQDDGAQMQKHVPETTESRSESVGNPSFQECNQDSGSQLSEEDGEQDDGGVGNPSFKSGNQDSNWQLSANVKETDEMRGPALASSAPKRPLDKYRVQRVITKAKKVVLGKNLQFQDNKHLRHQAKYRRVKNMVRKGHELAEITKCQVFLYVKDEFSKITYWGTSDALQLFKPILDSLMVKGHKSVQCVKFVDLSKPEECSRSGPSTNVEGPDLEGWVADLSKPEECSRSGPSTDVEGPDLEGWHESNVPKRTPLSHAKTRMTRHKPREKKVCLSKNMEFKDISFQRHQARYRRVKNMFKKGHELAELTKCQVFVYVNDEFGKTTYWGTGDALQLFQPVIDSLLTKGLKAVRNVHFVAPSEPSEHSQCTRATNNEDLCLDEQQPERCLGSVPLYPGYVLSSTCRLSPGASPQLPMTTYHSEPKSTDVAPHHSASKDTPAAPHSLACRTTPVTQDHSAPKSTPEVTHHPAPKSTPLAQHYAAPKESLGTPHHSNQKAVPETTHHQAPKSTPLAQHHAAPKNSPVTLHPSTQKSVLEMTRHPAPKFTSVAQHHSAPVSTPVTPHSSTQQFTPVTSHHSASNSTLMSATPDPASETTPKSTPQGLVHSVARRPLRKIKTVHLAKNLHFKDNKILRNQARYRRVNGIFRKGHELAEITKCQVFLYVKDEFSKTTYWGTSDALKLFQPTIDSLVKKDGDVVQSVKFVTPSKPSEVMWCKSPTNSEALDCHDQCSGHVRSVPSNQEPSTEGLSQGSPQYLRTATDHSAPESTPVFDHHEAPKSSSLAQHYAARRSIQRKYTQKTAPQRSKPKTTLRRSALYSLRRRTTPKSTPQH